jgi:hypothetical protein
VGGNFHDGVGTPLPPPPIFSKPCSELIGKQSKRGKPQGGGCPGDDSTTRGAGQVARMSKERQEFQREGETRQGGCPRPRFLRPGERMRMNQPLARSATSMDCNICSETSLTAPGE